MKPRRPLTPDEPKRAVAAVLCFLEGQRRAHGREWVIVEWISRLFGDDLRARGLTDIALMRMEDQGLIEYCCTPMGGVKLLPKGQKKARRLLAKADPPILPNDRPDWLA